MQTDTVHSAQSGFTLVEFLVTIAVLVIVMAVAAPSMAAFAANNQVVSTKSAFTSSIALARTEAARLGQAVYLQAAAGGIAGNEYRNGWAIYVDSDGSGGVNAGDLLLRKFDAPSDRITLTGTNLIGFQPTCYLVGAATQDYKVCRSSGSTVGFTVSVTPAGIADVRAISTC